MAQGITTSRERQDAISTFPADFQTVNDHVSVTQNDTVGHWYTKPAGATHIKLQTLSKNIRYRIDTKEATLTVGFQLGAGSDALIPVPNTGISICAESSGAILQYQWVR